MKRQTNRRGFLKRAAGGALAIALPLTSILADSPDPAPNKPNVARLSTDAPTTKPKVVHRTLRGLINIDGRLRKPDCIWIDGKAQYGDKVRTKKNYPDTTLHEMIGQFERHHVRQRGQLRAAMQDIFYSTTVPAPTNIEMRLVSHYTSYRAPKYRPSVLLAACRYDNKEDFDKAVKKVKGEDLKVNDKPVLDSEGKQLTNYITPVPEHPKDGITRVIHARPLGKGPVREIVCEPEYVKDGKAYADLGPGAVVRIDEEDQTLFVYVPRYQSLGSLRALDERALNDVRRYTADPTKDILPLLSRQMPTPLATSTRLDYVKPKKTR